MLDAYALGALPARPEVVKALAGRLVVTPNTSEAGILLEREAPGSDETADAAREIAARSGCVVALRSAVATPEGRLWVGGSGQAGLGTSGSGDVLAGIVAGLLARGAEPAQAAVWAAYLHATAGERLAQGSARSATWRASCSTRRRRCSPSSRSRTSPSAHLRRRHDVRSPAA